MADLDMMEDRIEDLEQGLRKLHTQLVELRHEHDKLLDETRWGEGEITVGAYTMWARFRGTLFLGASRDNTVCIETRKDGE